MCTLWKLQQIFQQYISRVWPCFQSGEYLAKTLYLPLSNVTQNLSIELRPNMDSNRSGSQVYEQAYAPSSLWGQTEEQAGYTYFTIWLLYHIAELVLDTTDIGGERTPNVPWTPDSVVTEISEFHCRGKRKWEIWESSPFGSNWPPLLPGRP